MNGQEKKIIVEVNPPCISWNRESQYIEETVRAYKRGALATNMHIIEETADTVRIEFHR